MMKHVHRKSARTPKETAELRADRERYQRDKPNPEQLLAAVPACLCEVAPEKNPLGLRITGQRS